jgi:ABC-type glycerol-3-phosphate transport system permease component
MKSTTTGAVSGCIVWVIVFGVLLSCIFPVAMFAGGFTSSSDFAIDFTGRFLCPQGTTPVSYSYATTTTDEYGNRQPSTAYELHCIDASGEVVKEDPIVFAFLWIGIVAVVGLAIGAILAFLLAAPAGVLIARLFKRPNPASMNIEPK